MKLRTAAAIAMIVFTVGLCFWLFVRPVIRPPEKIPRFVDDRQLMYVGKSEEGARTFMYADVKDEIGDWTKILAPFAPALSLLIAYWLKGKKK